MANYATASEALKRLALQYQGLMDAADAFDQLSRFESIRDTAQKEADKAVAEADLAKADAEAAKSEARKAKSKIAEMMASAAKEADAIIAAGQAKANALIADAGLVALEIEGAAKSKMSAALADVNANRARIIGEINAAQDNLSGLAADIVAKTAEAEEAQKRLDKVQAQIAKYLG